MGIVGPQSAVAPAADRSERNAVEGRTTGSGPRLEHDRSRSEPTRRHARRGSKRARKRPNGTPRNTRASCRSNGNLHGRPAGAPAGKPSAELQRAAYAAVFDRWGTPVQPSDVPCNQAPQVGLQCLKLNGTWRDIERIDHPVVVELWDDRAEPYYAAVLGHRDDVVSIRLGDQTVEATAADLGSHWYGSYIVLWQMPPDYRGALKLGDEGPSVAWLRQHLAAALQIDLRGRRSRSIRRRIAGGADPLPARKRHGSRRRRRPDDVDRDARDGTRRYAKAERRRLMSYILDALKKSEAERSRGVVPTLLTPPQTTFRSSIIGWGLMAALIVNAGLFAAWLYWPRGVATTTMRAPEPTPVAKSTTAAPSIATPAAASFSAAAPQQDTVAEPESPLETAVMPQPIPVSPPTQTRRAPVTDAGFRRRRRFVFDPRVRHRSFDASGHDERQTIRRRR